MRLGNAVSRRATAHYIPESSGEIVGVRVTDQAGHFLDQELVLIQKVLRMLDSALGYVGGAGRAHASSKSPAKT